MRRAIALIGLTALTAAPVAAQQFNYFAPALPSQNVWTDGVVLVDVDADDDIDIVFANGSAYGGTGSSGAQPQHLFLNTGSGFVAAHSQLNVANFNAKQVIAEDFDGDGDPDLFFASGSTGSPPRLLLNDGTGNFTDVTTTNVPSLALRSFSLCAGDIDDDGDLDVAVTDGGTFGGTPSQLVLLENDGNANFANITSSNLPADLYNCQDVTLFDYDLDFDVDIALSGKGASGKRARLYLNDGTGNFSIDSALDALGSGNTYEIDYGDLDGDGDFDSLVQSIASTNEGWGRNDGPSVAQPEMTFPTPNGQDDNEMAGLDYDNDGDLDVFVASLASTEKAYRNNGDSTFTNVNSIIQSQSDSTLDFGFHDLDGDGDYDMVTAQGESGNFTNKVYLNAGPADTLPPTILNSQTSLTPTGATTLAHCMIQDAVQDDGRCYCTVKASYTTDAGSGTVDADHMGGGLFRAAIPTAGATTLSVAWCATDYHGNSVGACGSDPWTVLGVGTPGINGTPVLVGSGPLTSGSTTTLDLSNAAGSAVAGLFLSVTSTPTAFKGGTLYTFPVGVTFIVPTDPSGNLTINFPWPAGVPSGFPTYWQYAIQDASVALYGINLSNAVLGTAP
ncbi:MAG: VCBS repeat-containing protein [Planctomycetes bacterium]|nr:VCBS repeat-containing protein [Planctomycetota bacterium]